MCGICTITYPSYTPCPVGYSLIHRRAFINKTRHFCCLSPYSGKVLFLMSMTVSCEERRDLGDRRGGSSIYSCAWRLCFLPGCGSAGLGKVPGFPGAPSQRGLCPGGYHSLPYNSLTQLYSWGFILSNFSPFIPRAWLLPSGHPEFSRSSYPWRVCHLPAPGALSARTNLCLTPFQSLSRVGCLANNSILF